MNKKIIALAVLAGSAFVSVAHAADGTINFTGNVTANACTVTTASGTQTVPLGTVASSAFKTVGDVASQGPISIALSACPASVTKASVRFDGATATGNSSLLGLTSGTGVATGVGIGIYESNGSTLIPVGTNSASQPVTTTGATLSYVAKYVSTSATIVAGTANAVSNFTMTYN